MLNHILTTAAIIALLIHLGVNLALSHDILDWVPDTGRRRRLLLLVWLLPIAGALFTYRRLQLRWFDTESRDSAIETTVSTGLLGLDSLFNPSSRHVQDAKEKEVITIKAEGEKYDRELPEFIDVGDRPSKQPPNE